MENIECIICDSEKHFNIIEIVGDRFNPDKEYQIQKCRCGMISTNPRLDSKEISEHYENQNYHPQRREGKVFGLLYRLAQIFNNKSKKKIIQKYCNAGFLLDYGGGDGQFQKYMSRRNWKCDIYEPYLKADSSQKKMNYTEVIKDNYYDVISMFHSLEHIHEIGGALNSINRALKKKGLLVISVPNHDAFERPFFKSKWIAYDVPRHLHHFNLESVEKILDKYRFKIIEYRPVYIDTVYNIMMSLNPKISSVIKAPFLILNGLFQIYINKNKASSIMLICNKNEN
ncbi:MAG: hypothetical protein CMG13_01125 [Candidatus Marinimicrobia bacterium]|nr:hypothetical protein [Candidatus Neomarinimicrobiota bacterium]|tara:strand:+ start:1401 stop:2255 length:855 start_codon:yes stop_codon:yes gene_type:complete